MAPLALIGPVTSGFSTASLIQTGVTTGANYMVKKSTGKTISEHALIAINSEVLARTYVPQSEVIPNNNHTKNRTRSKIK